MIIGAYNVLVKMTSFRVKFLDSSPPHFYHLWIWDLEQVSSPRQALVLLCKREVMIILNSEHKWSNSVSKGLSKAITITLMWIAVLWDNWSSWKRERAFPTLLSWYATPLFPTRCKEKAAYLSHSYIVWFVVFISTQAYLKGLSW